MTQFGKALNRLRIEKPAPRVSISDQLKMLRGPQRPQPSSDRAGGVPMGSLPDGRVESTVNGKHYLITKSYPETHFHGNVRLNRISLNDLSVLLELARCPHKALDRERVVLHQSPGERVKSSIM